jgi:hypothetical protein
VRFDVIFLYFANQKALDSFKPGPFTLFSGSICKFFGSTGEPLAFQTLTNQNGALLGCAVRFYWLKVWKASAPVLLKKIQVCKLICKKV